MTVEPAPGDLTEGSVVWVDLARAREREQSGHRPVVVVSSVEYLETVTRLAIVLPVTTVDRGWPNHVPLTGPHGLGRPGWAMTEQLRTIDRERITRTSGVVDPTTLAEVRHLLRFYVGR